MHILVVVFLNDRICLSIQCCLGDDIPKATVLAQVAHELEECKKSLSTYLHSKRKVSTLVFDKAIYTL